jgi:hypothetical protein
MQRRGDSPPHGRRQQAGPRQVALGVQRGVTRCGGGHHVGAKARCLAAITLHHQQGSERVIAGSDCGFGTFAGYGAVDADIVYAKLAAMREGTERVG